jgi:nucleoside-diphosphate-sugar epimerase
MRVLVLGGTGFIGSAVARRLAEAEHEVVGLCRSAESAERLSEAGHRPLAGDVGDVGAVAATARDFDAVLNLSAPPDQSVIEPALARRLRDALAGSSTALIWTSGVRVAASPPGELGDESSPLVLEGPVGWKARAERDVLDAEDLRSIAIRPPFVYAAAGTPVVELLRGLGRSGASVPYPGDGSAVWSTVHVEDLADLYLLALEGGTPGRAYIAASAETITVRELAEHIGELDGLVGGAESKSIEELRGLVGFFADLLASDAAFSGELARNELGWRPQAPPLREVVAGGGAA